MFFPVIRVKSLLNQRTSNKIIIITVDPTNKRLTADLTKEVYEARWALNPVNLLRYSFSRYWKQRQKILAHEARVQTLNLFYGMDEADCRNAELCSMIKSYDGLFRNRSIKSVKNEMKIARKKLRKWCIKHADSIRKYRKNLNHLDSIFQKHLS